MRTSCFSYPVQTASSILLPPSCLDLLSSLQQMKRAAPLSLLVQLSLFAYLPSLLLCPFGCPALHCHCSVLLPYSPPTSSLLISSSSCCWQGVLGYCNGWPFGMPPWGIGSGSRAQDSQRGEYIGGGDRQVGGVEAHHAVNIWIGCPFWSQKLLFLSTIHLVSL